MIKDKLHALFCLVFFSSLFSWDNEYLPVELLIDPSAPDILYVQQFQERFMGMSSDDKGYGSFGPKTTQRWKSIISNSDTYENLLNSATALKENSNYQDSNMILHSLIDGHYTPLDIAIKSKFLRAQIYYDLLYYEAAVSYFKILISEDISNEYRKKSLFMVAYILNNNLDMYTDALNFYSQFLKEYKNDDLVESVKYEIEQINNVLVNTKE